MKRLLTPLEATMEARCRERLVAAGIDVSKEDDATAGRQRENGLFTNNK